MSTLALEIEKELSSLEPESARHFERAVREILLMAKSSHLRQTPVPFSARIARHPAIGTWPADLDVDRHLTGLRNEWES
jgi:hypothetical protein